VSLLASSLPAKETRNFSRVYPIPLIWKSHCSFRVMRHYPCKFSFTLQQRSQVDHTTWCGGRSTTWAQWQIINSSSRGQERGISDLNPDIPRTVFECLWPVLTPLLSNDRVYDRITLNITKNFEFCMLMICLRICFRLLTVDLMLDKGDTSSI